MKKEDILESNKIIAKFMAKNNTYSFVDEDEYYWEFEGKDNLDIGKWIDDSLGKDTKLEDIADILKYNISWNWLIPVVEKIEKMGFITDILSTHLSKNSNILKSIYLTVVEFIKHYNKELV